MKKTKKLLNWFFKPPYYGVPWLIWVYAFVCLFIYLHGDSPLTGRMIGFDDQVRMVQVLQWINGQGWYEHNILRANWPEGFHTIWTRIVDIPIAIVIVIAQQFVTQKAAMLIASVVIPFTELAILFAAGTYFARPLVGKNYARLMALFLLFTSVLNQKKFTLSGFHPGEVGHHAWYIILNILMFGAAARIAVNVRGRSPALVMSIAIAVMLAVGIEGFPMVAGTAGILAALAWAFNNASLARRGAQAMGLGALFTLLLVPMNQPPALLFEVSFAEPSILGPILVGSAAAFLTLEIFVLQILKRHRVLSLMTLAVIAASFGVGLITAFPQMLRGAGAALSPAELNMALHQHPEAWFMYQLANTPLEFIGLAMPLLLALISSIVAVRSTQNNRRRILYLSYAGFAVLAGGMAQLYWRYYHHAMTTASVWLLWAWKNIRQRLPKNTNYALASLGVFVILCPFWMLLLPAMEADAPFLTQVVFFPAKVMGPWDACGIPGITNYINAHYSKDKNLIVPGNDSAAFLLNTELHIDFLANFPSGDKFLENDAFFQTQDTSTAKIIAINHGIDLIALCPYLPLSVKGISSSLQRVPMFMEVLAQGKAPPWLKRVDLMNEPTRYVLYEVNKSALNEAPQ